MKKKHLVIGGIAAVVVLAIVIVAIVIANQKPNYEKLDLELTNRDFIEYANQNKDMLDENSLNGFEILYSIDKMLGGTYSAAEMHAQLTSSGYVTDELSVFHIEQMYGLKNFDSIDNDNVTLIELVKYICLIANTEEGKAIIGEENSAGLATLSESITFGIDIAEMEFTSKTKFSNYVADFVGEFVTDRLTINAIKGFAGNAFTDYKKANPTDDDITLIELVVFAANNNPDLISMIPFEIDVEMVNKAAALYERSKENCAYTEVLPLMNELVNTIKTFVPIENTFNYTNETVKQIYIMYFYDQGEFANARMSGKDFVSFANEIFDNNNAVADLYPGVFVQQLDNMIIVDEFLCDTTPRKWIVMFESINGIFGNSTYLIGSANASEELVGNLYLSYSKNK